MQEQETHPFNSYSRYIKATYAERIQKFQSTLASLALIEMGLRVSEAALFVIMKVSLTMRGTINQSCLL